jgi:hypothetical protein|tara:strand:- start:55 stop:261 length:207 start_codon:yes stop_codon:yes gene_type:complete
MEKDRLIKDSLRLQQEATAIYEALTFYAEEDNYRSTVFGHKWVSPIENDSGRFARETLEFIRKKNFLI